MSELTDWINYELYPSLFDVIPQALPEHNFRKVSGDWNRVMIKEVVAEALQEKIERWEKKNGPVKEPKK